MLAENESTFEPTNDPLWVDIQSTEPQEIVRHLLQHGCQHQISDLLFCAEEHFVSVAARHFGLFQRVGQVEMDLGKRCIAHIKSMAGMDITEKRRPQDGRWIFRRGREDIVDLRINTLPTLYGEDCVLRVFDRQTRLMNLDALGLIRRDFNHLVGFLTSPSGLIVVTGPTGSGKTTTLYACLHHLNNGTRKINTIEDPVEYALAGVRQTQVNPTIQLGFAEVLRSVLRQAPDVIMVGEIRDAETAQTAVRAANSGHLVLATMHTPVAAAAVQALLHLGVHPSHLATSLIGVIAQRLVRTLNKDTRVPFPVMPQMFDAVRKHLEPSQGEKVWGPAPARVGTMPYTGRMGVFEVMSVTHSLRELIVAQQPAQLIHQKAMEEGLIGLRQAALIAVAKGLTSVEEVFRVIPSEYLLAD
jgi:type II secretory ATPase GspE/PulE/Tfp pilus assembly ATPase PilB-like protein